MSAELLIDGIWEQDPPAAAANALQALASRLRRALHGVDVESHPAGYRLAVRPEDVDVVRFEQLASAGRGALAGDPATAARILREALALWRGPALLDVAGSDFFRAPVTRLTELRMAALEDRIEADLRVGHGRELTGELSSLVAEHPLREKLVGALMRALVAAGRPAEALTVYGRAREALAEELGTDPSAELSALHTAVLRGELAEAHPVPAAATPTVPPARAAHEEPSAATAGPGPDAAPLTNLRSGLASFVGREADLARVDTLIGRFRLTTLTGPGGAGKTRLAVQAARPLLGRFPDGVWLVELAPLSEGSGVPQAVLAALGLREHAGAGDPAARLAAALRARSVLLVLDNCEHLIEEVAKRTARRIPDGRSPGSRSAADRPARLEWQAHRRGRERHTPRRLWRAEVQMCSCPGPRTVGFRSGPTGEVGGCDRCPRRPHRSRRTAGRAMFHVKHPVRGAGWPGTARARGSPAGPTGRFNLVDRLRTRRPACSYCLGHGQQHCDRHRDRHAEAADRRHRRLQPRGPLRTHRQRLVRSARGAAR
ncbi:BTAD domain-containing putative transcriptional regulator [Streptomyces sp. NPDC048255]|uniref:AfsR/SARP family transcriptional regulator n=1 Tax=Streptomyces sp. NPDC048255 TaxID=3154713 RepID=UPI0033FEA298